jgi:hypothetical protein
MPLGQLHVDPTAFAPEPMPCLRCGAETMLRFAGPCEVCADELRTKYRGLEHEIAGAEYEPKMNVTANAVALKDD